MSYQSGAIKSDDKDYTGVYDTRTVASCCAYLLPHLKPHYDILDVGCGPGNITVGLARACPQGKTLGVDISEGVVKEARQAYCTSGDPPNLSFDVCLAEDLSRFPDASFDVVHAHHVLMHLKDPAKAVREFYRVCKPGGIIATRDPNYEGEYHALRPDNPAFRELGPKLNKAWATLGASMDASSHKRQWLIDAGASPDNIVMSTSIHAQHTALPAQHLRDLLVSTKVCTEEEADRYKVAMEAWAAAPDRALEYENRDFLCFKK